MKKIFSILSAIFIFAVCGVFTACGDKYSNFEYYISYAFTQDAKEWYDGTNGITVNYGADGENSLQDEDGDGYYTLYLKVEVRNVKAKHIDDIVVSKVGTSSGVAFSQSIVKQGQVLPIKISGRASSTLKMYETNSGNEKFVALNIYRDLESIEVDYSIRPAIASQSGRLALAAINNITYQPAGLTNQTGVTYAIKGCGYFDVNGEYCQTSESVNATISEIGVLRTNNYSLTPSNYVIHVEAISRFNPEISAPIYVYVADPVENNMKLYYDNGNEVEDEFILYMESTNYSSVVVRPSFTITSIYGGTGLKVYNGTAKYSVAIYIEGKRYNADTADDMYGIMISDLKNGQYRITAINTSKDSVKITFAMEIDGFVFDSSSANTATPTRKITVHKSMLADSILFNNALPVGDLDFDVYSTSNENYKGVSLTLHASPVSDNKQMINFTYSDKLVISDEDGQVINPVSGSYSIESGSTIFVKFANKNVNVPVDIVFSIITSPGNFAGETPTISKKEVKCTFRNKVTADRLEMVNEKGESISKKFINSANDNSSAYIKVYYTGTILDRTSIALTSLDSNIKFLVGGARLDSIDLTNCTPVAGQENKDVDASGTQKYTIYEIPLAKIAFGLQGDIQAVVSQSDVVISSANVTLESVKLADETTFDFSSNNASKVVSLDKGITATKKLYSVPNGEMVDFTVTSKVVGGAEATTDTIIAIDVQRLGFGDLTGAPSEFESDYSSEIFYRLTEYTKSFSIQGTVVNNHHTGALRVTISYYKETDGVIALTTTEQDMEVSVYNPISRVVASCPDADIAYINSEYTEASTANVSLRSQAYNGTPTTSVNFSEGSISNATGVRVTATLTADLKVTIKHGDKNITEDVKSTNGYIISDYNLQTITVSVNSDNKNVNGTVSLTFTALRFGKESSVRESMNINVVSVDKVKGVELDEVEGKDYIKEESNNSRYVYMSYLKNDKDSVSFLARAYYDTVESHGYRYDELSYLINEASYNDTTSELIMVDGKLKLTPTTQKFEVNPEKVQVNGVEYIKFTVNVDKDWVAGGLYQFVVVAKDSFDDEKRVYTTYNDFFIQISDGSKKSPYMIGTDDIQDINNNMSANYVLSEDITINPTDTIFKPIGSGEVSHVDAFTGTFSGKMNKFASNGSLVASYERTITFYINNNIETCYDASNEYFGLFAAIGSGATVTDLNIVAIIDTSIENEKPLHFGVLAGKNEGLIENVSLTISGSFTHPGDVGAAADNPAYVGGIVGLNTNIIRDIYIDNTEGLRLVAGSFYGVYFGLVSARNEGYIIGNYAGKNDLESLKHDIVANITIQDTYDNAGSTPSPAYVGVVVAVNNAEISDMLIGGKVVVFGNDRDISLAGIAAQMTDHSARSEQINNCVAIGLNLIHNGVGDVAGIVANASVGTIANSSFMSAVINYYIIGQVKGEIVGSRLVAGAVASAVASASSVTLHQVTVENFAGDEFYTLQGKSTSTIAGLVAGGTATVEYSFVNANMLAIASADGDTVPNVYTLAYGATLSHSYYLGNIALEQEKDDDDTNNKDIDNTNVNSSTGTDVCSVYKFKNDIYINGAHSDMASYIETSEVDVYAEADVSSAFDEVTIDASSYVAGSYYVKNANGIFELAEGAYETVTYYALDNDKWTDLSNSLYVFDTDNKLVQAGNYEAKQYYTLNDVDFDSLYYESGSKYIKYNTNDYKNINKDTTYYSIEINSSYDPADLVGVTAGKIGSTDYEWIVKADMNTINLEDILWYFPYLTLNGEPIMIVQPNYIEVAVDNEVIESIGSVEMEEIPDLDPEVSSSHLINYHNYKANPLLNAQYNTYDLVTTYEKDADGEFVLVDGKRVIDVEGLIDLTVIPEYAQGGVVAEIYRGTSYAKIKDNKITFLGVSGSNPIIVKFYSIFNPELVEYVAFYTELGATDIVLSGNRIQRVYNQSVDYEMFTYTGSAKTLVEFSTENIYKDVAFDTVMTSQLGRLRMAVTSDNEDVKVEGSVNNMGGVSISCADFAGDGNHAEAIVTFELYIDGEYYGSDEDILLTTCTMKVIVYKSAHSVDILSGDIDSSVGIKTEFVTELRTGYIDYRDSATMEIKADKYANQWRLNPERNQDTLRIQITPVDDNDNTYLNALKKQAGVTSVLDLFNITATYKTIYLSSVPDGYRFNISLELVDEHNYRYIEQEIKLNIKVMADTSVDKYDSIVLTLMPQNLSSARISNYTATSINAITDSINMLESNHTETALISPGGIGGVMAIHLEPSYSKVFGATLMSTGLQVPSLGADYGKVFITFQQLVRTPEGKYQTVREANIPVSIGDTEKGIQLQLVSQLNSDSTYSYTGVIYIHTILTKFKGLNDTYTVTLRAQTEENGEYNIVQQKHLLTEYMPGAGLVYNGEAFENGYIIQRASYGNTMELKLYGYEFHSEPTFSVSWYLGTKTVDDKVEEIVENDKYKIDSNGTLISLNDGSMYNPGDYVTVVVKDRAQDVKPNADGSYTLMVSFSIHPNIPVPFKINAQLSLATEGSVVTSDEETDLIFYPTDYVIQDGLIIDSLIDDEFRLGVNDNAIIGLKWQTMSAVRDFSDEINEILIKNLEDEYNAEVDGDRNTALIARLLNLFKLNGVGLFAGETNHPEFKVGYTDGEITVFGLATLNRTLIKFGVQYGYAYDPATASTTLKFGTMSGNSLSKTADCEFYLRILSLTSEDKPKPIYTATDFLGMDNNQDYILMNDITLENYSPIDKKIASLDGNNRIITIKSFKYETNRTNYGLFGSLSTYTNQITNKTETSILKNVIVNYSGCEKITLTNMDGKSYVFGGLVADNSALIYNCDIINYSAGTDQIVNIIVDAGDTITFGGLVGINKGIITNSRVGTNKYIEIKADTKGDHVKSARTLGTLQFVIGNTTSENKNDRGFLAIAGGFVGVNSGTIATSYLANTSLISYSQAPGESMTAGFVADNSGEINYSYVKALESSVTYSTPRATGRRIENVADGNVGGFVYVNKGAGIITNSYANTELYTDSAYVAGFVYNNIGTVRESYAACSLKPGVKPNSTMQPFVGANDSNDLLSSGTLENTYYYETDNDNYYVITEEGKDQAVGYSSDNFSSPDALSGFVFVLSESLQERNQGVWAYYTSSDRYVVLPELVNANAIARSNRYEVIDDNGEFSFVNALHYRPGSENNPHIVRSADEYNTILAKSTNFSGYVRFINNIAFNDGTSSIAIKTRTDYMLGDTNGNSVTSIEGNGMTISNIHTNASEPQEYSIGLFSQISNAYIKNLNLKFDNGTFSTASATYSGGLAGRMHNTVAININLTGSTIIQGDNIVGGLAGMVTGDSLIYGIDSNLSVDVGSGSTGMYYTEEAFKTLLSNNAESLGTKNYTTYVDDLSFAGGIVGILDISEVSDSSNFAYINVNGETMQDLTKETTRTANVDAAYAGGVAGYAGPNVYASRVKFNVGDNTRIFGSYAAGGLFAVSSAKIETSQVTYVEDTQYEFDTVLGQYIIDVVEDTDNANLDAANAGNLSLISSTGFAGGLVGIGINQNIGNSYAKATFANNETDYAKAIGGLVGISIADSISYSYAVPYVQLNNGVEYVGGLIGRAYGVDSSSAIDRNKDITEHVIYLSQVLGVSAKNTEVWFTFSTILADLDELNDFTGKADYICPDYSDNVNYYLTGQENNYNLNFVFGGKVFTKKISSYTNITNNNYKNGRANEVELRELYDVNHPNHVTQYQSVFSGWSTVYWTLDPNRYFPLLLNEESKEFIEIKTEEDLYKIQNTPDGNFKIMSDIDFSEWCKDRNSNYIFDVDFTGTMIGETANNQTPYLYNLFIDAKNPGTAGFFRSTNGASFSNINFSWADTGDELNYDGHYDGITVTRSDITTVGMISPEDNKSQFSNICVGVRTYYDSEVTQGVLVRTKSSAGSVGAITGFGGIVGNATHSYLMACEVNGGIDVTLGAGDTYIGGLVANGDGAETDTSLDDSKYKLNVIGSSVVRANNKADYKVTSTEQTKSVYYGGAFGYSRYSSLSAVKVGDSYNSTGVYVNKYVNMYLINDKHNANVYMGGIIGYAENTYISSGVSYNNMYLSGDQASSDDTDIKPAYNIGGLAGAYDADNLTNLAINDVYLDTNIHLGWHEEPIGGTTGSDYDLSVSNLRVTGGVAYASGHVNLNKLFISGTINTNSKSNITAIYSGGLIALTNNGSIVNINEAMSTIDQNIGTASTLYFYSAGLIGQLGKMTSVVMNYTVSSGRITVLTSKEYQENSAYYFAGMIADTREMSSLTVTYSYSTSSIITSSMASDTVQAWNKGALFGYIQDTSKAIVNYVYYSTDLALAPEDSGLGTNLPAYTMFAGATWNNELIDSKHFEKVNDSSLPIISNLRNNLISLGFLTETTQGFKYSIQAQGTSLAPYILGTPNISRSTFAYYILNTNTLSHMVLADGISEFNGILIGVEGSSISGSVGANLTCSEMNGLVDTLAKYSAISNIHINVNDGGTIAKAIVNSNLGTVFNCSVQGLNLKANAYTGLVVNTNKGLVSYCYSSAEITETNGNYLAGIACYNIENTSKIESCYFTGYINNVSTSGTLTCQAAGIAAYASSSAYIYNCYMAGAIEGIDEGRNSFYIFEETGGDPTATVAEDETNIFGSNNYVDMFANVESSSVNKYGIAFVRPSDIMSAKSLEGSWYTSVTNKIRTLDGYTEVNGLKLNLESLSYGYNYSYPIYKFNKVLSLQTEIEAYQLYTGRGYDMTNGTSYEKDVIDVQNGDYFKIPHLGVLDAVRSVSSKGLLLQIIYDIDKSIDWDAVGIKKTNASGNPEVTINDWNVQTLDKDDKLVLDESFNGQLVSNKNYLYNESKDSVCVVAGLSRNGLFANINNATIAYLKLGNFEGLINSGALGVNVKSQLDENEHVNVHDIEILKDSIIKGKTNVGALFGEINGKVNVYRFTTNKVTIAEEIDGECKANTGLIAGFMDGGALTLGIPKEITAAQGVALSSEASVMYVKFGATKYAGGIVGQMQGGIIDGQGTSTYIETTSDASDKNIKLGGIVGIIEGKPSDKVQANDHSPLISNVIVELGEGDEGILYLSASAFGGFASHVKSSAWFESCEINLNKNLEIAAGTPEGFGLVTAKLINDGNVLVVNNFTFNNEEKCQIYYQCGILDNINTEVGVGVLTGYQKGNLAINIKDEFAPIIDSTTQNVGGITGHYAGGLYYVTVDGDVENYKATIRGKENVGGAFGLVTADVINSTAGEETSQYLISDAATKFTSESGFIHAVADKISNYNLEFSQTGALLNFLASAKLYTTISPSADSEGSSLIMHNFGGLFGLYLNSDIGNAISSDATVKISNANNIDVSHKIGENGTSNREIETYVLNVGGIVGKFEGSGTTIRKINNAINNGHIKVTTYSDFASTNPENTISVDNKNITYYNQGTRYTPYLINVGGIVGHANNAEILNCVNSGTVQGYRNVGGIVGTATETVTIENSNTYLENDSAIGIYFDKNYVYQENKPEGTDYYGISSDVTNKGAVHGVLNVGGIVGLADGATISKVWNAGSVYGNTSVGGVVGYSNKATIIKAIIFNNEGTHVEIRGVYYSEISSNKYGAGGDPAGVFVPTSVGGLVGSSISSTLDSNLLYKASVTSSQEGLPFNGSKEVTIVNSPTISTISNNMASLDFSAGATNGNYISASADKKDLIFDAENYGEDADKSTEVKFDLIRSGYGGFVGSTDTETISNFNQKASEESTSIVDKSSINSIVDLNISAELGINVGTLYGYVALSPIKLESGSEYQLSVPKIYGKDNQVSGAYNVGGLIGYLNAVKNDIYFNYSQPDNLLDDTARITLQNDSMVGMYVGGLFGKLESVQSKGLVLPTATDGTSKILINTDGAYYIGGLVGRLVMNSVGSFEGNLGADGKLQVTVDKGFGSGDKETEASVNNNLGGLIGMLKLKDTTNYSEKGSITISGKHSYAFTVNTIENQNYFDAESLFNMEEANETEVYLIATAYYINKDNLSIQGTSNADWYSGDTLTNPLNPDAKGWSKEYTGFRAMQRCIPSTSNNGAEWDSIENIYDASKITHVATIASLGLTGQTLPGNDWEWNDTNTSTPGEKDDISHQSCLDIAYTYGLISEAEYKQTNDVFEIKKPTTDKDGISLEERLAAYNSLPMIAKIGAGQYIFNPNYICYTIYEEADSDPTLYSAMGIATLNLTIDKSEKHLVYGQLKDGVPNVLNYALGAVINEAPSSTYYIDCNNPENNLKALTYFNWSKDNDLKQYKTLGKADKKLQDTETSNVYLSYFVPGYMPLAVSDDSGKIYGNRKLTDVDDEPLAYGGNAYYGDMDNSGAYFVFEVVYDNATANGLPYLKSTEKIVADNTMLSRSGSIFEVTGYSSRALLVAKDNPTDQSGQNFKYTTIALDWIITGAFTLLTLGAGGAIAWSAKAGLKFVVKMVAKEALKWVIRGAVVAGAYAFLRWQQVQAVEKFNQQLYQGQTFAKSDILQTYDQHHGLISNSYTRTITYTDGIVDVQADNLIKDYSTQQMYTFYSTDRPSDYYSSYYIGVPIKVDGGKVTFAEATPETCQSYSKNTECAKELLDGYKVTVDQSYALFEKYIYQNGVYYINIMGANYQLIPSQDFFDYTYVFNDIKIYNQDKKENYYIEHDGYYYVLGHYDQGSGTYYIGDPDIDGDGTQDAVISSKVASNRLQSVSNDNKTWHYKVEDAELLFPDMPSATANTSICFTESAKSFLPDKAQLGYDYMEGMIYTAEAVKWNSGLDCEIRQFKYHGYYSNDDSIYYQYVDNFNNKHTINDKFSIEDFGTEGIDYFKREYTYTTKEKEVYSGTLFYVITELGNSATSDYDYTYWLETPKHEKEGIDPYDYDGLFDPRLGENATLETGFYKYIDTKLYPHEFATGNDYSGGPYKDPDFNKEYCNDRYKRDWKGAWVESDNVWTIDPSSTDGFYHDATYYYYEGGYISNTSGDKTNVFKPIKNQTIGEYTNEKGEVVKLSTYTEQGVPIEGLEGCVHTSDKDENGNTTNTGITCYKCIINYWTTYDEITYNYCDKKIKGTDKSLKDMYQVSGGVIYIIDENYCIDKTGMLQRIKFSAHADGEESNYNFNKYLSNTSTQFYTRYKYMYKNSDDRIDTFNLGGKWLDARYSSEGYKPEFKYTATDYYLIPEIGKNKKNPNNNKTTLFTESVKVTIGGGKFLDRIDPSLIEFDKKTGQTTNNSRMVASGNVIIR